MHSQADDSRVAVVVLIMVVVAIIGAVFYAAFAFERRRSDLFDECIRDGHARYDCYAKIYGGNR